MDTELNLTGSLINSGFTNIDIEEIFLFLEGLDYDLKKTKYIGMISSKNERLAKYFFLRDQIDFLMEDKCHIREIFDLCIDWDEFWRLLVVKKGFCCIRLSIKVSSKKRFIFLAGPNILTAPFPESSIFVNEEDD
tara:strand:- start:65 stop:469 length:405 start_codon:yes stop_codon:yes gene_type:complete